MGVSWFKGPAISGQAERSSIVKVRDGTLSLCQMALIDEDIPALIRGDLGEVRALTLRENCISGEGLAVLTRNATLRLTTLNLGCNRLSDESLGFLRGARWQLRELLLNKNAITGYGLKYLSKLDLSQLQRLNLNENYLSNRGAEELVAWKCPQLRQLCLFGNCLKDRAVRLLLSWPVPQLQILYIADNQHTGEAVAALLKAQWPRVKELQLYSDLVPEWEYELLTRLLQAKWPHCEIFI